MTFEGHFSYWTVAFGAYITKGKGKCAPRGTQSSKDHMSRWLSTFYQADRPQVMVVINPAVHCHYFLPDPRLPSQL